MSFDSQEHLYMQRALELAEQGRYTTRPNPAVGCVIVKNGQIIGEGFHQHAGGPHAEIYALQAAGLAAQGATVYVTLEPCAHFGRTPPCVDALMAAQVARVIIAVLDPNPLVAGQGMARLQAAGIETLIGLEAAKAYQLNRGFLQVMAGGLPYVRLKIAASLDGRTAMASGESKWITSPEARQDVQHLRAKSGAIFTGIQTVLADDPLLTVRLPNPDHAPIVQPLRVVFDRQGRFAVHSRLAQVPEKLLLIGNNAGPFEERFTRWPEAPFATLLARLRDDYQIYEVLIEAGATLSAAFLEAGLVDELVIYMAPTLLGSQARPMVQLPFMNLAQALHFEWADVTALGPDLRLTLKPAY